MQYSLSQVMRIQVWKPAAMCLTILQIMQMVVGVIINIYTYNVKSKSWKHSTFLINIVNFFNSFA